MEVFYLLKKIDYSFLKKLSSLFLSQVAAIKKFGSACQSSDSPLVFFNTTFYMKQLLLEKHFCEDFCEISEPRRSAFLFTTVSLGAESDAV